VIRYQTFLALWLLLLPAARAQQTPPFILSVKPGGLRVVEAASDHLDFAVRVQLRSPQHLQITHLALENMYLNGMPVFFHSIDEALELTAGASV
jgi:hypothetical protein